MKLAKKIIAVLLAVVFVGAVLPAAQLRMTQTKPNRILRLVSFSYTMKTQPTTKTLSQLLKKLVKKPE